MHAGTVPPMASSQTQIIDEANRKLSRQLRVDIANMKVNEKHLAALLVADANMSQQTRIAEARRQMRRTAYHSRRRKREVQAWKDIAHCLECPILHDTMTSPLCASDGYVYERSAMTAYVRTFHGTTSPITREDLKPGFYPCRPLRDINEIMSRNHLIMK
jgi:hypothetical protein